MAVCLSLSAGRGPRAASGGPFPYRPRPFSWQGRGDPGSPADAPGAAARWCQAAGSAAAGTGCSRGLGAAARGPGPRSPLRRPRTPAPRSRCHPAGSARARSSSRRPPASSLRKSSTSASCRAARRRTPAAAALFRREESARSPIAQPTLYPAVAPSRSQILANTSRGKTSRLMLVGSPRVARIGPKRGAKEDGRISELFPPTIGAWPASGLQLPACVASRAWADPGQVPAAWAFADCGFQGPRLGAQMVVLVTVPNGPLPEIHFWGAATWAAADRRHLQFLGSGGWSSLRRGVIEAFRGSSRLSFARVGRGIFRCC